MFYRTKPFRKNPYVIGAAFIIVVAILVAGYIKSNNQQGNYRISDVRLFRSTEAWALAEAVERQAVNDIGKLVQKHPDWLNIQEPQYGATLLYWAVGTERYNSAAALLQAGADPNIGVTNKGGITPLYEAACYSHVDNDYKQDPKYVKLLLKYGADPNKNYLGGDPQNTGTDIGSSPLMHSIGCGIEKTKALVEGGADIDHKTESGRTAAIKALLQGGPNSTLEGMQYAYYLIVEKRAKVNEPYKRGEIGAVLGDDPNDLFYPVDILRSWTYALDSPEYRLKMEIVAEFKRQGVDYWGTEIPKYTLEHIKKIYPDTWQEYIKKY